MTRTLRADQLLPGDRIALPGRAAATVTGLHPLTDTPGSDPTEVLVFIQEMGAAAHDVLPAAQPVTVQALAPAVPATLPELPDDPRSDEESPDGIRLDGYEWINALRGWYALGVWGTAGWDLGSWPYQIVAHIDLPHRDLFGYASWVEGDIHMTAHTTRSARDQETAVTALHWWVDNDRGPDGGLTAEAVESMIKDGIPPRYARPYTE